SARCDLSLPKLDLVGATGDLLEDRLAAVERIAALVDISDLHRLTELQRSGVGLFRARDQSEQCCLSGTVWTNDADNAAAGQREIEAVDQQVVAVPLFQPSCFDDHVAEA